MGRKALVLGASGKVGSRLAHHLLAEGWEVMGAARFSKCETERELRGSGIETIPFEVTRDDPKILPAVDCVFLEIWDPSRPDLIWPINFYGVGRVVERYAGEADFINGCTINVYGNSADASSEHTPCRPNTDYGRSRYAQERLIDFFCHRSGSRAIHLRYAHANSSDSGILRRMAEGILVKRSLGADPEARLQVIALEDFVRVTAAAVERVEQTPPAVNCCHPRIWSRRELAEELLRRLGRGEVIFDAKTGGVEQSAYARAERMIEWFGPPQVPLDEVLGRVAAGF